MAMAWYVVNTYSGYENKAKAALEERIAVHGVGERFGDILVPTEQVVEVYRILQGILGPVSHLRGDSPGAFLHGELERANRAAQINTFGGGVNEIQRELVATAGLGIHRGR